MSTDAPPSPLYKFIDDVLKKNSCNDLHVEWWETSLEKLRVFGMTSVGPITGLTPLYIHDQIEHALRQRSGLEEWTGLHKFTIYASCENGEKWEADFEVRFPLGYPRKLQDIPHAKDITVLVEDFITAFKDRGFSRDVITGVLVGFAVTYAPSLDMLKMLVDATWKMNRKNG